ncbi:hypothetical protein [Tistrella mobilis]|uniref:Flagellar basal body-associated protein FliL n=1 Tax=Tistrella mobilis (strain KA081020-065) TaxID=1110502 RepID=I3TLL7_TISMK|nr:hypothetical protein [Tistrella mobilis]AFK53655.1 hypothetical protein TMO_1816 [Tistrella mobilis KA081020-065]
MRVLLIFIVSVLLVVAGGGGWLIYRDDPFGVFGHHLRAPAAVPAPEFVGMTGVGVPMIRHGVVYRYLMLDLVLELVPGADDEEVSNGIERLRPVLTGAAQHVSTTADRLGREPTLDEIKVGLTDAANDWFGREVVADVLIQRTSDVAAQKIN